MDLARSDACSRTDDLTVNDLAFDLNPVDRKHGEATASRRMRAEPCALEKRT